MERNAQTSHFSSELNCIDAVLETANHGFECADESLPRTQFRFQGFVKTEVDNLFSTKVPHIQNSFVSLFGQLYDIEFSQCDLERLFRTARHRLCMLDKAARPNLSNGDPFNNRSTCFRSLRTELRHFYVVLRSLILIESRSSENAWVAEELLPTIMKGLTLLRMELGWLVNLPSSVLNISGSFSEAEDKVAFHLFHCHLELRWLHTTVISVIFQSFQNLNDYQSFNSIHDCILLIVWDLLQMGIWRFSKLSEDLITHRSFFNCVCVKELWFLLKSMCQKWEEYGGKSFWTVVNCVLESITSQNEGAATCFTKGSLEMPSNLFSHQPITASVWALKHLAEIFVVDGDNVLSNHLTVKDMAENYDALKRILKSLTDSSMSLSESQLRVTLSLVRILMTEIWSPKPDPIMILWDSFSRNLDSAFQVAGASAALYAVPCESPKDILMSVFNILKPRPEIRMNSYDIFLSLLGSCLADNPSQWKQKMQGRFYSKLSSRKIDTMSEMGIYHLTQLFLTVALSTNYHDVRERFQMLFSFKTAENKRNEMVLKAHLSFLYLLGKKKISISPVLSHVVEFISDRIDEGKFYFPRIFVSCLKDVMAESSALLDSHIFVGKWIHKYLLHYHPDSGLNLICALHGVMRNLEIHLDRNGGVIEHEIELLILALWEHLLPYVAKQMEGSPASLPVPELAVSFTLLSLHLHSSNVFSHKMYSFQNLLDQFLMTDSASLVNVTVIRRYLCIFLSHEKSRAVIEDSEDLQLVLTKCWVYCSSISSDIISEDLKTISQKVFEFSLVMSITNSSLSTLQQLAAMDDPLNSLCKRLGEQEMTQQRRKEICKLLQPLERLGRLLQQHLFPKKSKDENNKPEKIPAKELPKELVLRGYFVLAWVIFDCNNIIYYKGMASSLLPRIIMSALLAPAVYDTTGFRLPSSLNDALRECLIPILFGLYKLDPSKDICIKRYLGDIIKVYLPRMVMEHGNDENPFVRIWDKPEHMDGANYILQIMCDTLLQVENTISYIQCLKVLQELIRRNNSDELIFPVLIQNALPCMLEVVGTLTDIALRSKCKEVTEKTLKQIFSAEAYLTQPALWERTNEVLVKFAKKYLMKNIDVFKRILLLLKGFHPILKRFLPSLKELIDFEKEKGTTIDKLLTLYESLQKALIVGNYQN